ncbi:antibiotic biosynthesis monooxygenase [Pseudomonas sp. LJDD11]|uniref:antibiotic biosynthesis monooxygenase n=1 Tax=Pseudomonas sp. LJDD11 TaxID=2931984 RepID=UPI00211D05A9|nr:antibiotic biosynthesis monooxygenase [Pseudomonas sp. LJDD11]MCQ9426583.1 antibiotic biosynthesis monooxygenase [Pseudomonas sp. LJDD11]
MHGYSQLVEFSVEATQQSALVTALAQVDEQYTSSCPGFMGASVQASEDGRRVLHQVLWQSRQACEAALSAIESSVYDLNVLIRLHRVRAASFGSYQVLSHVPPRV